MQVKLTPEVIRTIEKILSGGDNVEVKKNAGKIAIIKIDRKLEYMTPITG